MLYEYIPASSPENLGLLTKRLAFMSQALEVVSSTRSSLGTAKNHLKGAKEAVPAKAKEIPGHERSIWSLGLRDRHSRLTLARTTLDVQHALIRLTSPGPDGEYREEPSEWLQDVEYIDVVCATEQFFDAIAAVAGRKGLHELLGVSEDANAHDELRSKFYRRAKKLIGMLPELPFWFGREENEAATNLLADCITTAVGAKGVGMYVRVNDIDEAEVTRVVDYLKKAGWFDRRKEPEPSMNYPSICVYLPLKGFSLMKVETNW